MSVDSPAFCRRATSMHTSSSRHAESGLGGQNARGSTGVSLAQASSNSSSLYSRSSGKRIKEGGGKIMAVPLSDRVPYPGQKSLKGPVHVPFPEKKINLRCTRSASKSAG